MTHSEYTPWLKSVVKHETVMNDFLSDYVNKAEVRTALHIPESAPGWDMCWDDTKFAYNV